MKEVEGKNALVTGAAMGMGRGIATLLAQKKANVVLVDINGKALEETAGWLRGMGGGKVYSYVCDITDRAKVYELADKVHKDVGKIDVLVNNAGIVTGGEFLKVPDEKHQRVMDVNIMAIMWMTRAFMPDMMEKKQGHIINLSSAAGLMGVPDLSSYCASKHAVLGFSESVQFELFRAGLKDINITCICPSYVATGMFDGVKPPKGTKWLTTDEMAEKIFKSMQKNKTRLIVPRMTKIAGMSKLMSAKRLYKLQKFLKVDTSMSGWTGRK
jgi:all-trans-retinol dehydrogenase (NAD+)